MVHGVQVSLTQVRPLTSAADNLGVGEGEEEGRRRGCPARKGLSWWAPRITQDLAE